MGNLPRTSSRLRGAVLLLPWLTTIGAAQQTLVVGAGQPFLTIPAAIAAASPGDTVLVMPGTYTQPLDIAKGIRLVGHDAILSVSTLPGSPWVLVHDLPVAQSFAMLGFHTVVPTTIAPVRVRDCAGLVAFRDLGGGRWGFGSTNNSQLYVAASFLSGITCTDSTVVLEDCLMEPPTLSAIFATNSSVTVVHCTVPGSAGPFSGPGVHIDGGTLVATDSEIRGSNGGFSAIVATGASLVLDASTALLPTGSAPPITGAVPTIQDQASLRATTDGTVAHLDGHGPAGGLFVMALGLPGPRVATVLGDCWVDLASLAPFYVDVYDPIDRRHALILPHPPLPPGLLLALQPVHFPADVPTFGWPSLLIAP